MKIEPNEMEELRENAHEAGEFMIGTLVVGLSAAEGIAENLVAERDALAAGQKQMGEDLIVIQRIHSEQKARLYGEIAMLKADIKAAREQEPVAGQCRFDGESEWKSCTVVHHLHVHANPKEWPHYETRALYALPVPAESAIETPAKVSPCAGHAVQQEADEAIGLAQALEQHRARKIVDAVSALPVGGKHEDSPSPFHAGYQLACDEVMHRLLTEEWDGCLTPPGKQEDDEAGGA